MKNAKKCIREEKDHEVKKYRDGMRKKNEL
jgi:hypothetical protein